MGRKRKKRKRVKEKHEKKNRGCQLDQKTSPTELSPPPSPFAFSLSLSLSLAFPKNVSRRRLQCLIACSDAADHRHRQRKGCSCRRSRRSICGESFVFVGVARRLPTATDATSLLPALSAPVLLGIAIARVSRHQSLRSSRTRSKEEARSRCAFVDSRS